MVPKQTHTTFLTRMRTYQLQQLLLSYLRLMATLLCEFLYDFVVLTDAKIACCADGFNAQSTSFLKTLGM